MIRQCFTTQHQICKTKTKKWSGLVHYGVQDQTIFWSQTGLVLSPTVSDNITGIDYMHQQNKGKSLQKKSAPAHNREYMAINSDTIAQKNAPLSFTSPGFTSSVMYISSVNLG